MAKSTRARYTLEVKLEAVRIVKGGQSLAAVSKILGIADQMLHNWIKAGREGRLGGTDGRPVSPEQMEIARLRAELARVKMESVCTRRHAAPLTGPRDRRIDFLCTNGTMGVTNLCVVRTRSAGSANRVLR